MTEAEVASKRRRLAGGLLVMAVLVTACSGTVSPEEKARRENVRAEDKAVVEARLKDQREHAEAAATVVCRNNVQKRLDAPLTALFAPPSETIKKNLGGGNYQVSGYVDSKNGSGVMVRTRFTCDLHTLNGQEFIIDALDTK